MSKYFLWKGNSHLGGTSPYSQARSGGGGGGAMHSPSPQIAKFSKNVHFLLQRLSDPKMAFFFKGKGGYRSRNNPFSLQHARTSQAIQGAVLSRT